MVRMYYVYATIVLLLVQCVPTPYTIIYPDQTPRSESKAAFALRYTALGLELGAAKQNSVPLCLSALLPPKSGTICTALSARDVEILPSLTG